MITRFSKRLLLFVFIAALYVVKIWRYGVWLRAYVGIYQRFPFMAAKQDSVVVTAEAQESLDLSAPVSFPSSTTMHKGPILQGKGSYPETLTRELEERYDTGGSNTTTTIESTSGEEKQPQS